MTISLKILLIIYYLFLAGWLVMSTVAIFHMLKYGVKNFITVFSVFVFVGISMFILISTYAFSSSIDWSQGITIFDGIFGLEISF